MCTGATLTLIEYLTSVAGGVWWAKNRGDVVHVAIRRDVPRMKLGYCVTRGPNAYSVPLTIGATSAEIQEIAAQLRAKR
jgi:hypothetical protein